MYDILSETLIPICSQENYINDMSPNNKEVTYFIEQKENSNFLKDKEVLIEKPPTINEQEILMDDPLYTLIKNLRLENPKSKIVSHVNLNSLKKRSKCTT